LKAETPALAALMAGRRILVSGDGSIARDATQRLAGLDVPVVHESTSATDAIVTWQPPPLNPGDLGVQIQHLTGLLSAGLLRRVVLLVSGEATVAVRVAETLTLYAAAHLVLEKTRFNMLRLPPAPFASVLEHAVNAALMLLSGRMDAVHGQVLSVAAPTSNEEVHA